MGCEVHSRTIRVSDFRKYNAKECVIFYMLQKPSKIIVVSSPFDPCIENSIQLHKMLQSTKVSLR